jgi:hypothetical protein
MIKGGELEALRMAAARYRNFVSVASIPLVHLHRHRVSRTDQPAALAFRDLNFSNGMAESSCSESNPRITAASSTVIYEKDHGCGLASAHKSSTAVFQEFRDCLHRSVSRQIAYVLRSIYVCDDIVLRHGDVASMVF